jgi:hypothetical protein
VWLHKCGMERHRYSNILVDFSEENITLYNEGEMIYKRLLLSV